MKNILVSGASGIVGYGILRSLRAAKLPLNLIGVTIYSDSIAPAFCDVLEIAPRTSDDLYPSWLLDVIERHRVDLIIPGIEVDLYRWNDLRSTLEAAGVTLALNRADLISLCQDKWIFYQNLLESGSDYVIPSSLSNDFDDLVAQFGLPFLLKPRIGFGARGQVIVGSSEDFTPYGGQMGSILLAQPILGTQDDEYTTAVFGDGRGGFFCQITLKRKLSKEGFTDRAEVVQSDVIQEGVSALSSYLKPLGPTNFQFRLHEGKPFLLEVNPRISSSTSIRTLFGYNESSMAVQFYLDRREPSQPAIKKGRAVRYIDDYAFYQ